VPAKSRSQFRFFQAAAHGDIPGVSPDTAKEFIGHQSPKGLPEKVKRKKVQKASLAYWKERFKLTEKHLGQLMLDSEKKRIMNQARAHAGGMARAEQLSSDEADKLIIQEIIGEIDDLEDELENELMPESEMDVQKDDALGGGSADIGGLTPGDVHSSRPISEEKKSKRGKLRSLNNIAKVNQNMDYSISSKIIKSDEDQRLITGIVLEPYTVDSQGDWETPESIESAAHKFMSMYRGMGIEHVVKNENIFPVESWITPIDMIFDDGENERIIKSGTWMMTSKVLDDEAWGMVKSGELTGYSVEGSGKRSSEEMPSEWYMDGNVEKRDISQSERDQMSSEDFAGKDKSFPIHKPADVMAAMHSLGRAGSDNYNIDEIRANIKQIAKRKNFPLPKSMEGD